METRQQFRVLVNNLLALLHCNSTVNLFDTSFSLLLLSMRPWTRGTCEASVIGLLASPHTYRVMVFSTSLDNVTALSFAYMPSGREDIQRKTGLTVV